ncbi:MAG: ATP-binding protein, partial [Planctomycetes bacterium]|nr:ATP-binding protein [Planctomycetota bacterium]
PERPAVPPNPSATPRAPTGAGLRPGAHAPAARAFGAPAGDRSPAPGESNRAPGARDAAPEGTRHRTRYEIKIEDDLLTAGREIWLQCIEMGFSNVESMQVRTAFSELARNILKYAVEGEVLVSRVGETGIKLLFIDQGPGIEDVEKAMQYGFSTGGSLGLGLPGSKKLADHFDVVSSPGRGTQVTFIKYGKTAPRKTEAILRQTLRAGYTRPPAPPAREPGTRKPGER